MTPNRRDVLLGLAFAAACGAVAGVPGPAGAHTPYGQWVVYRQKHLLIGAHRGDGRTYELSQAVVAALAEHLPDARARIARGPRPERIASLMGTGQLMTAVLSRAEALAMAEARPPFESYLPTPLTVLAGLDEDYLLFASPDMPPSHAWQIVEALDHAALGRPQEVPTLAVHPGASAFWNGALLIPQD